MKIIFLCGGLEPGRDGVGDYIRRLADELIHQGHDVGVLAFNDHFVNKEFFDVHNPHEKKVTIFRIPSGWNNSKRLKQARKWLELFNPDIISLQFVSYSFNKKGLPFTLIRQLKFLIKGYRCHIMFHELWIGAYLGAPLKEKLIGVLQRILIRRMLSNLSADLYTTSNPSYVAMLDDLGVDASQLPLFGTIPIAANQDERWLFASLAARGCRIRNNRERIWLVGFFGALHPSWEPEPFFSILRSAAVRADKHVCVVAIGRLGLAERRWDDLAREYKDDFGFCKLGEHTPERISQILRGLDFGWSATPWELVGKSSAAASLSDHGIPVVVTSNTWRLPVRRIESEYPNPLLIKLDENLEDALVVGLRKAAPVETASKTTSILLGRMEAAHGNDLTFYRRHPNSKPR